MNLDQESTIDFSIIDQYGNIIYDEHSRKNAFFNFTAYTSGIYRFIFNNKDVLTFNLFIIIISLMKINK